MSQENVESALAWQPMPSTNVAESIRDEVAWAEASALWAPRVTSDFKCRLHGAPDHEGENFEGLQGLRSAFLEWLAPWKSYRAEVEETVDLGDRVLVLVRDYGRQQGDTSEIALAGANVSTFRDGKLASIDFYLDRDRALADLGLEEYAASQENVELIRSTTERVNQHGIVGAVADLYDEDAIMYGLEGWPDGAGPWRGREAILAQWRRIEEDFREQEAEVAEISAHEDWVISRTVWRVRSRHGLAADFWVSQAARIRGGKVIEVRYFAHHAEALEAVGLEE
jgi:ketosteroid isomerase-like protein